MTNTKLRVSVALAALWLCACGGSGGGGDVVAANPAPPPSASGPAAPAPSATTPAPASPPTTAPVPATAVELSGDVRAQPNTAYAVRSNGGSEAMLTLGGPSMASFSVGDRVSVFGVGTTPWKIVPGWESRPGDPSSNVPHVIDTRNLPGNVPAGVTWQPRLPPAMWHWIASDNYGRVLVAADNPGQLRISRDGGQTWDAGNSPVGPNWVSAAVTNFPGPSDKVGATQVGMLAAAFGGGLHTNRGDSRGWSARASGDPGSDFANQQWESVVLYNGQEGAAAAVLDGPIYLTLNVNAFPWAAAVLDGTTTRLVRPWRGLANARGGQTTVAVSEDGGVFVSTNGSHTFTPRAVSVGGKVVAEGWYRVALSADGNTIAVAGRFNSGLYVSHDQGFTWSRAPAPTGDYTAVAMSADGATILATMTNGTSGRGSVQLSRDGGSTFAALTMPGTDTNWRAATLSADGNAMAVAAGTFTMATGQLYTSIGNRTGYATGALAGRQGSSVELEYTGGGSWRVLQSGGGPLTVR